VSRTPDTARRGRAPLGQAGFTLLELALVLLIIGIMVVVAYPKFRNLGGGDVKMEARTLIGRIQALYGEATFTRRTYRLVYDLDAQRYWGEMKTGDDQYQPVDRTFMAPVALPDGVKLKDVITERAGKLGEGKAYTYFLPLGRADYTTIHLAAKDGPELTLFVTPLTGRVTVEDGYKEDLRG
jgi:prepilin-type N-terminal cleavage/methylation domain-containing protein